MSLIACPECKAQVSTRAAHCPHCGCPIGAAGAAVSHQPAQAAPPPLNLPASSSAKRLGLVSCLAFVAAIVMGTASIAVGSQYHLDLMGPPKPHPELVIAIILSLMGLGLIVVGLITGVGGLHKSRGGKRPKRVILGLGLNSLAVLYLLLGLIAAVARSSHHPTSTELASPPSAPVDDAR